MRTLRAAILVNLTFLFFSYSLFAQTPVFDEIIKSLHKKSWYYGCPECIDKFDAAYAEVAEGSQEWIRLVNFHGGCLMEGHREAEAITLWNKALKIDPENHLFYSQIGTAYFRTNDLVKSEEFYQQSNKLKLNRIATYHLATIHYIKGAGIDDSVNETEKNLKNNLLLKAESEINTAIDLYERRKNIGHISRYAKIGLHSLLAQIKVAQGQMDKAKELFGELISDAETATNWHPERKPFILTELYFNYGQMLYLDGQEQKGLEYMNRSIATAPTKSLKSMKEMAMDLTINPEEENKVKKGFSTRYPQIKTGTAVPLY